MSSEKTILSTPGDTGGGAHSGVVRFGCWDPLRLSDGLSPSREASDHEMLYSLLLALAQMWISEPISSNPGSLGAC